MESFTNQLNAIVTACLNNAAFVLILIASLWVIQFLNAATGYYFNRFGLIPRNTRGLLGIPLCPLLHGNFEHLFVNSIVLFVLLSLMLLYGMHTFIVATLIIVLGGGFLVWLFARRAIHIGASGLVMGYWGFLLVSAYRQGTMFAIIIGVLCLVYFSSLFMNLFPTDRRTSWEAHLFGFIAGVGAVFAIMR